MHCLWEKKKVQGLEKNEFKIAMKKGIFNPVALILLQNGCHKHPSESINFVMNLAVKVTTKVKRKNLGCTWGVDITFSCTYRDLFFTSLLHWDCFWPKVALAYALAILPIATEFD